MFSLSGFRHVTPAGANGSTDMFYRARSRTVPGSAWPRPGVLPGEFGQRVVHAVVLELPELALCRGP